MTLVGHLAAAAIARVDRVGCPDYLGPSAERWRVPFACFASLAGDTLRLAEGAAMADVLVTSDPAVMMGKPVIVGTRITVELILEKLGAGETVEEILKAHPRLSPEAIQAALLFGAQALRADVVYPIAAQS